MPNVTLRPVMAGLLAMLLPVFPAVAGEPNFRNVLPVSDPFKDLPGVKRKEDKRLKSHLDCDTSVASYQEHLRPPHGVRPGGLPPARKLERVYTCRDGNQIFQSSKPPVDYDWGVYKDRY